MIQAWFQTPAGQIIPALVPNDEVREIARMSGMDVRDLFCIDIPGGATRNASIKVLVEQSKLEALYASDGWLGTATCAFHWQENSAAAQYSMNIILLPPRPVFMVGGGNGLALVEAVDVRYIWKRTTSTLADTYALTPGMYSSDGRYADRTTNATSLLEIVQGIRDIFVYGGGAAALESFSTTPYTPDASLLNRVINYKWPNQASLALMLDTVLSLSGYALLWNPSAGVNGLKYVLKRIESDAVTLTGFMADMQRAVASGLEPPSSTIVTAEPLYSLWQGTPEMQYNRGVVGVDVLYPSRACEGQTHYPNNRASPPGNGVRSPESAEVTSAVTVTTARTRRSILQGVLNESRAVPKAVAVPPGWTNTTTNTSITSNLVNRTQVNVGTVVWGGWPMLPNGVFRLSTLRYTLGERSGNLVPLTITGCEESDWLLGPDGLLSNDPREIIMGTGMVQARRLSSGTVHIDVAAPMCRIFPARITTWERCAGSGNGYWQFKYSWEEIEPDPLTLCPNYVSIGNFARTSSNGVARNLCETPNVFVSPGNLANIIAPGVFQADYPANIVIDAVPIMVGTIVMMCEQFPTNAYPVQNPPRAREYWFSMPQAVKVECIPEV